MKAAFVLVKCELGRIEEVANALMETGRDPPGHREPPANRHWSFQWCAFPFHLPFRKWGRAHPQGAHTAPEGVNMEVAEATPIF